MIHRLPPSLPGARDSRIDAALRRAHAAVPPPLEDVARALADRVRVWIDDGSFDPLLELGSSLSKVQGMIPTAAERKAYAEDAKAALEDLGDAALLFLTHPRAGLNGIVTGTRRLFETLDIAGMADGVDVASRILGKEVPAALDSTAKMLADLDATIPPPANASLGPVRAKLADLQETFGPKMRELTEEMGELSEKMRDLDRAGRNTDDPDDLAKIAKEMQAVLAEASDVMREMHQVNEELLPQLAELRNSLATGPLAGDKNVKAVVKDLANTEKSLATADDLVVGLRPMVKSAEKILRKAQPYLEVAIDLAENHAQAADSFMGHVMYGIGFWENDRPIEAVREWTKAGALLPLGVASWLSGAGGIGLEHLGKWMASQGPWLAPLAYPTTWVGQGFQAIAGGLAWVNDKVVDTVASFGADVVFGGIQMVADGVSAAIDGGKKLVDDGVKAAKKAADDVGKKAKKFVDDGVNAAKKLFGF